MAAVFGVSDLLWSLSTSISFIIIARNPFALVLVVGIAIHYFNRSAVRGYRPRGVGERGK
jgi:hypothetical protein